MSAPNDVVAQIFRTAQTSKRKAWYMSHDILDVRVSTTQIEEMFATQYYSVYFAQCAVKREVSEFLPNEEFQLAVDSLEENPAVQAADIGSIAQKHLHDVVDVVTSIVDDFAAEVYKPVHIAQGVGRAYVERGFFFFVWDSYVGEKFGRLELRNCRRLMELQMMSVHVPLTYHIVYKGRGVTIQSLVPVDQTTRVIETPNSELHCLAHEISAALCLSHFDENRQPYYLSNNLQAHIGRDSRLYFLQNSYWSPPWLSSKGERLSPEQRFSCIRPELLLRKGSAICCRAFQKDALATENAAGMTVMRKLLDKTLHEVPKILGTVADQSPDSVVMRFRRLGFNYSMLGFLLLSLFRNVSPPEKAVRAVLTEMFVRGIKQYIMWKNQPPIRNGQAQKVQPPNQSIMGIVIDDQDTNFDDVMRTFDTVGSRSFLDDVAATLRAFLEYQGSPMPRPATLLTRAIPAPLDVFGGEIIPHIYKKFRLLRTDVDLYGKMDDEQKLEIYQKVCRALGITVKDGSVSRVLPIVLAPSVPGPTLPDWILRHSDILVQRLLTKKASRNDWVRVGPALIPLLRLQPQNLSFYTTLAKIINSLKQPPSMTYHILQCCFNLPSLMQVIHQREQHLESNLDRTVLIQLYRKRAYAYHEEGNTAEAIRIAELAMRSGIFLLEAYGNHYSQQFRRLTSELAFYSDNKDFVIELNMLRLISRYCEPDELIADDFLQLGVARARNQADLSASADTELEWDLSRAVHLYATILGEKHPKAIRAMANLAIVWLETKREAEARAVLRGLVEENVSCPPDVKELAMKLIEGSNVLIIPDIEDVGRFDPLMFILHVPRYGI